MHACRVLIDATKAREEDEEWQEEKGEEEERGRLLQEKSSEKVEIGITIKDGYAYGCP